MDVAKDLKNTVNSITDSVREATHTSTAEAERTRRDLAGDTMTTDEKAGSLANEAKNRIQGGIDHAKAEASKEV
jgi:hypothetical protein